MSQVWQFPLTHPTFSLILGYLALTLIRQMPQKWTGWYDYIYAVGHSLAASPPALLLQSKLNITASDGSSVTKTETTTATPTPTEPKP